MRKRRPAAQAPADPLAAFAAAGDFPRQQMAVAAEGACAFLRGVEAMQKIQEDAAHRSLTHYQRAADQLSRRCGPAELLAIQAELARCDWQDAARFWEQIGAAALEMHTEMLACCAHLVDSEEVLAAAGTLEAIPALPRDFDSYFHGNARSEAS